VLESPAACTQVLRLARTGRIAGGANTSMDAARVRRRPALAPARAERVPACHRAEPTQPSRNSDAFEDRAFEDFENFENFPKLRTIFKTRAFKTVEKFQNFEAPKPSSTTTCRDGRSAGCGAADRAAVDQSLSPSFPALSADDSCTAAVGGARGRRGRRRARRVARRREARIPVARGGRPRRRERCVLRGARGTAEATRGRVPAPEAARPAQATHPQ